MSPNIGFVSTRFAGTDGVTLESEKWALMLEELGHKVFWFAGQLDKDPAAGLLFPPASTSGSSGHPCRASAAARAGRQAAP